MTVLAPTALATSPSDLRAAARVLLLAGSELEEVGARLARAEAATAVGWQGVAALAHRSATQRVQVALVARCEPVSAVGRSLATLADQGERSQSVVLSAQRARSGAQAERTHQIRLLGTVTDPVEVAALRERIIMLDSVIRRAEDEIDHAEGLLEQGRRAVEQVLEGSWGGLGVDDLRDLVDAGEAVAPIWRGGGLVVVGTRLVLTSVRLAKDVNPFARYALEARLDKLLKAVMKKPIVFLLTGAPARLLIPLVVISDAFPDLMDGGGYTGWRGFTLRLTAGLAIPGSIAMVMPHPVVAGLGAVTVGAYYLVKGGLLLENQQVVIARAAKALWGKRETLIEAVDRVLTPTPAFPLGPLGPMVPIGPARDLIEDLPRLEEWGRFLPGVGGPLPIPDVPIGPGLRWPALPPPVLGPGSQLLPLLPGLGRLF